MIDICIRSSWIQKSVGTYSAINRAIEFTIDIFQFLEDECKPSSYSVIP